MIIAVNTISFIKGVGENFFSEVFSRITKKNPQHTFIFIFDGPYDPSLIFSDNIKPTILGSLPRKPLLWRFWYDYKIPMVLKKYKANVFVSSGICSLRTKVPQCLLIDDVSFLEYPHFFLRSHFNFYKKTMPDLIKKAKVIVTGSLVSKKNIIEKYKTEDKIEVVYAAANEIFNSLNFEEKENIKEKYAGGNEYFLFTGEISLKNNLLNLLKAFSFFKKRQKSNMQLLICGIMGWKHEEFIESLRLFKFKNEVKLYSNLHKEELIKITASAYAMVYPAYFQNFDTAPFESMRSEVPLVAGNTGAMQEMYGEAALYANPADHKMIAEKMMVVFKDEELRKQLIEKGMQKVQNFTWDKTALLLWESILKTSL